MAMICIPIKCEELSSLKKIRASTFKKADLVEIWVDSMPTVKPEKIMRRFRKPLIIVNKGKEEHGSFCGTEKERIEILARYAAAGVAYVDLNVNTPKHYLREIFAKKNKRTKIILSLHDFTKTPALAVLKKARDKAFRAGAHLFKAAVFARTYEDNLTILRFLAESRRARKPCVAHCMGKKGRISRLLAPLFGSYIIYAAPEIRSSDKVAFARGGRKVGGSWVTRSGRGRISGIARATAPGQFTVKEYEKFISLLKI